MTALPDLLRRFLPLASVPTRIEPCPQLSRRHGASVHLKRDDTIGCLHGGTKLRALEHLLQDAREHGSTDLVTLGEATSSQCRLVSSLGRRFDMKVHLLLRETATVDDSAASNLHHPTGQLSRIIPENPSAVNSSRIGPYPLSCR